MKKPEKKTTDEQLADLLLQKNAEKQERVSRVAKILEEASQKERVTLVVSSLNFTPDGRVSPVIQLVALD
jgi:S-adenosylmethionine/arginine decarboxylase-like enzyme